MIMSGTAIAQAIGFALSPIISRLFTPADFGVVGSFGSVATIIGAGITLEYSQAIMLPKSKQDALTLLAISCLSTFAVGFLCFLFCLVAPGIVNGLMKTSGIWALALLVFVTVVGGLNSSCQAWCVRVKAFKHTSASQVVRSLFCNNIQLGVGCFRGGAVGLILSDVIGDVMATLYLLGVLLPDLKRLRSVLQWRRMAQLAKEYSDFPMYSASQNVINALSSGLPVLLLTHYYGIVVAGAYAFGLRILNAPMSFLLRALRQVLFQKAGEALHQGRPLTPLYLKITIGLFAGALLPCLVFLIWAPQIFTWVFGSQWLTAGEFARSLVIWMVFAFCNLPAVLFARIIRIQRTIFCYDLVLLAARILALILGGGHLSAAQTILIFSLVGAIMNTALIVLVGRAIMKTEGQANWRAILKGLS
jgi:O-antigen/teichoic acid export membrane protein